MTMRERIRAFLRGQPHDRVPFIQYHDLAAGDDEIWSAIGRENMGVIGWTRIHRLDSPNCRFESWPTTRNGRPGVRNVLHTPRGPLVEERTIEPNYGTSTAVKHYITEPDEYHKLLSYLRDVEVGPYLNEYLEFERLFGDSGISMPAIVMTPFQQLWVRWVSLEDLCGHMVDYPDLLEEVIAELARVLRDCFRLVREVAEEVDLAYVNIGDNVTTPVIGDKLFRQYCLPYYNELADLLADAGKDIPVAVHMDGDLKPLASAIADSRIRIIDSFSPPPDNDTSVAEALEFWPRIRLGANFPSSVHLAAPETIYRTACEMIQQSDRSGRLMIQISENVPREMWRRSFPEIVRAIQDCGSL